MSSLDYDIFILVCVDVYICEKRGGCVGACEGTEESPKSHQYLTPKFLVQKFPFWDFTLGLETG